MEQIKCENCNGVGLISSGADKLNLNHGATKVCDACTGTGKLSDGVSTVDNSNDPKAEGTDAGADTGSDSGTLSAAGIKAPEIGDPCEMGDGSTGVLSKTDKGNWLCVPKPPEA